MKVNGKLRYLWRAVDHEGEMLETVVTAKRDKAAAGAVGVNVNDTTELQARFGGWKLSGLGRELGTEGLMAFRETKHIRIRVRSHSAT